jgi:DNA polymerase-3 subunit alpha
MTGWIPLHVHSHFSLLDGLSKPYQIANRCEKLEYKACAISDHGTVSGAIDFASVLKKKDIKPILGCELYISGLDASIKNKKENGLSNLTHLPVLAKNKQGWTDLISAVSLSNSKELFYYKPRIDLDRLKQFTGNLIAFSGHPGSDLGNCIFTSKDVYNYRDLEQARGFVHKYAVDIASTKALEYQELFGKGNFFLEIQLIDKDNMPAQQLIADVLREVSKKTGIECIATCDAHYPEKKDAIDQRILLCAALGKTLNEIEQKMSQDEDVAMSGFFRSDNYHIPSLEEMQEAHKGFEHELENTVKIAEMCEVYDVLNKPQLPTFECPNDMSEIEYLRDLCRQGWRKKIIGRNLGKYTEQDYAERVKKELGVIENANLSGYFLIVQDYINWTKNQGWLVGSGRGSGAGSIVLYLLNVTTVDPIEYGLMFERFYNAGRNTEERVSLPDIDCDFPVDKRGKVIEYIRNKYTKNHACQMMTIGRLQGRQVLKEVFRAHAVCSPEEQTQITNLLPQENTVTEQLQDFKKAIDDSHAGLLRWVFYSDDDVAEKYRKRFAEYCYIDDDGTLKGSYAEYFNQAIRIEGTFKSQGKHPAGVIITSENLNSVCPMIYDKTLGETIAGLEMDALESIGLVKFDILGLALLDKLMGVNNLLRIGKIKNEST